MCGIKVHLRKRRSMCIYSSSSKEQQRFIDFFAERAVSRIFGGSLCEIQIPSMQLIDIGKSSGGKGSEDIESLGILMIGLDEGVGSILVLFVVIGNPIYHPSDLDNGQGTAVRQYQRHLQDGLEGIADVVDVEFRQRFGRIIPEQAEPLTLAGPAQTLLEGPNLTGEHQGRVSAICACVTGR